MQHVRVATLFWGQIGQQDFVDVLGGSDGPRYAVQKEWSVQDGGPIAFAPAPAVTL
jgi:hypothetical protein